MTRWSCPNCSSGAVTHDAKTPMHPCRGLKGLMVPLVVDGTRCKVEVVPRGDYVGKEQVATDGEGRVVMAAVTTRDDGQDCTVFAPAAQASRE